MPRMRSHLQATVQATKPAEATKISIKKLEKFQEPDFDKLVYSMACGMKTDDPYLLSSAWVVGQTVSLLPALDDYKFAGYDMEPYSPKVADALSGTKKSSFRQEPGLQLREDNVHYRLGQMLGKQWSRSLPTLAEYLLEPERIFPGSHEQMDRLIKRLASEAAELMPRHD